MTVPTTLDTIDEGVSENYTISVGGVSAVGTITDDDAAPTIATVTADSQIEGTALVHSVTLSNASSVATTFAFTLGGGSATAGTDYTATPTFSNGVTLAAGVLTVPAGVTSFTVTVPTINDVLDEANETYNLTVGGVTGVGTIVDNDSSPVGNADNYNAVEGATTALATVLTNDTDADLDLLTVSIFATNNTGIGTQVANGSNTVTTALGGTVTMNANGTFSYIAPARNHAVVDTDGPDNDSFVYKANDGTNKSAWTTVTINITDTNPVANNDVDSVGIGGTVNGNVITGAGGVTADTLNVDSPHNLSGVVWTSGGAVVSNTLNVPTNVRTIVTSNGTLAIDLDDGSYTYTAGGPVKTVTNPTGTASFTSQGINLYAFDTVAPAEPYITAGNPASGINLANLNATSAARVRFQENLLEVDDGLGVEDAAQTSDSNRIENGEQLVISLGAATRSATVNLTNLLAGETATYEIYNAAGAIIGTGGTTAGVAGGVTNMNITAGVPFSYIVVRSTANGSHFRVDGISFTPEPSGTPDVFTYTLADNDGDSATATLTMNYDSTTTALNDVATVFEAGIQQLGAQNAGTFESQPSEIATGNILANDTGISTFTDIVNVNGILPVGGIITISDARGTMQIYTQTVGAFVKGDYVYTLTGKTTQGVNDTATFTYQLNNSATGENDNATLTLNIVDDVPIAESNVTEIAVVPQPVFNLFFMIDVSGSMTRAGASGDQRLVDANGNATITTSTAAEGATATMTGGTTFGSALFGTSTLAQTRDAVKAVISKYFDESTNVSVKLGIFSTGARTDNIAYTTKAAALAAVDALTNVAGGTNYSAGLTALQGMIGAVANPNDGVQRVAYFITDGVPSTAGAGNVFVGAAAAVSVTTDPTNPATSTGYQAFVNTNNIQSYGLAVGPAVPNTTALNGVHNVDADASDVQANPAGNGADKALVVSDISKLTQVLTSTVPEAFGGNIGGAGGGSSVRFGADGGYVQYIEVLLDSADPDTTPDTLVRFTYNIGTNQVSNNNNAIAGPTFTGSSVVLDISKGFTKGSLVFDFLSGDYTYVPQGSVAVGEEITIGFGVIDGDGDTATATNTIRIVDGKPIAVNDFETLVPNTGAANTKIFEGNVLNAEGTDGGGTQISGFRTGASGEDYVIDGADVTSIVFKGVTFNLTAPLVSGNILIGTTTYTREINADGELRIFNTAEIANELIFHRDGYYKYTPPAAQTAAPPQGALVTVSLLNNNVDATAKFVTLEGYTRTANLNNAADATVTFGANGAGVNSGTATDIDSLENLAIRFNRANYPQGVQNLVININAASLLGNNGNGGIGALQYTVYDIAGNLLGQFASDQEGNIAIPYSNVGAVFIQPNSSTLAGTGSVAGSAIIAGVNFNAVNVAATANVPDEVIQYTITDKDTLTSPDSSTASLTLHVVTNEFAGTAGNDTDTGLGVGIGALSTSSNDLISGLAGNDVLFGLAGSDVIRGGAGNDTIDGGADDDQLYGGGDNDTIIGGTGNDYLYGEAGSDNLQGGDGADKIYGGLGVDTIQGGIGDDLIVGGAGNDTLIGNAGADTFKWELADKGLKGSPALDTITDFNPAAFGAGGDVLDLRDILSGESHVGLDPGNLENYLHFEKIDVGGGIFNTIVHISSNGEFVSGFNAGKDVQRITLTSADLVGSFTNDQDIIQNLLTNQKLITD